MNVIEFMNELVKLYPLSKEFERNDLAEIKINQYVNQLSKTPLEYDYKRLLDYIGLNYKYKTTPDIPYLIETREQFRVIKPVTQCGIFCIFFENGKHLDFVVTDLIQNAKSNFKDRLESMYGKVLGTKMFPAKTVISSMEEKNKFKIYPAWGETYVLDFNQTC